MLQDGQQRYVKLKKNQTVATYKATVSQESNIFLSYTGTYEETLFWRE
jgi:hypothetical protein